MHIALHQRKCLSHHWLGYAEWMETPNERLKRTREQRYKTARDAAAAMGAVESTYIQHENGTRGSGSLPRAAAERYAAFFRVSLDWLLTGKGDEPSTSAILDETVLEAMLSEALYGVPPGTPLADYPRLAAPGLRGQLERFLAGDVAAAPQEQATAPGKAAQSRAPTKRSAPVESRTT